MDPEAFRVESRDHWERSAAGWSLVRDEFRRDTAAVTEWMLDAAAVGPGMTVLDVAAGAGDVGLEAARRVRPDGRAIITDGAENMVQAAREWAEELGLGEVETRVMEAEWLDLPAASVDAVLCRWGIMLVADPEASLREMRRVLRSEGRVALAVWDSPERNQWMSRIGRLLADRELVAPPAPGDPGPFALADRARLEHLLWGAGLVDVRVDAVAFHFRARSLDAWWERLVRTSQRTADAVAGLAPAEHYALRDAFDAAYSEYADASGAVAIPAQTLVAVAEA